MRVEGSVTSVSWIPSESITGAVFRVPFEMGLAHYDEPPPEVLSDAGALLERGGARFVNRLQAWIDADDGVVIDHGHLGAGSIGWTTVSLGRLDVTFAAIALPDRRRAEPVGADAVRFEQTAGGRMGIPAPRRVSRPPYVQVAAPLAWTTLSLTLRADGTQDSQLAGASTFPRHWLYDRDGRLAFKSATIDYHRWSTQAFGRHTPWGDTESPAFVSEVESALERQLSAQIMRSGAVPRIRRLRDGEHLTQQGEQADEVFVLLDGVLRVDVDGNALAEIGPGAVLGERAILESGHRTASLIAVTKCTVAVADRRSVDMASLERIAGAHRREDTAP